jgi:hypothetical protein
MVIRFSRVVIVLFSTFSERQIAQVPAVDIEPVAQMAPCRRNLGCPAHTEPGLNFRWYQDFEQVRPLSRRSKLPRRST